MSKKNRKQVKKKEQVQQALPMFTAGNSFKLFENMVASSIGRSTNQAKQAPVFSERKKAFLERQNKRELEPETEPENKNSEYEEILAEPVDDLSTENK